MNPWTWFTALSLDNKAFVVVAIVILGVLVSLAVARRRERAREVKRERR